VGGQSPLLLLLYITSHAQEIADMSCSIDAAEYNTPNANARPVVQVPAHHDAQI